MKIMVLGGDGFCGWPTALRLSATGHDVFIVDNLSRRNIDNELSTDSLTPITTIDQRIRAWNGLNNTPISFQNIDVAKEYEVLAEAIDSFMPDAVVHFAEQRAAPYSMKSARHKLYTVNNNVMATTNLLTALVDKGCDAHFVHLGTMGVYGYSSVGLTIPEGYLDAKFELPNGDMATQSILYPTNPGSVYHATKSLDQILLAYFVKNDGLRVTDLHQGIVWGTQTDETRRDELLINRFDYDGDYGTVLNRFLMQASVGHPLTVHGTGGQTRAFINIQDTAKCIELAIKNAPEDRTRVRIFNQATETHRVRDLATLVSSMTGVDVNYVENPRKEDAENDLTVANDAFLALGLNPITLSEGLLTEISETAGKYLHRVDPSKIPAKSLWVKK